VAKSIVVIVLALLVSILSFAQGDVRMGTWRLNPAMSKFSPGPAPKMLTLTWEPAGDGFKLVTASISETGEKRSTETVAKTDGKDYPLKRSGRGGSTSRAYTQIDSHTFEEIPKNPDGTSMVIRRLVFSKNGKTLTVTETGKDTQGRPVNSVMVFEKE
jgi:hypothetical protein